VSPTAVRPDNATANASLRRDPALRPRIGLRPVASCEAPKAPSGVAPPASGSPSESQPPVTEKKATSADVLEALHRATGLPIVADYYTRLYPLETVSLPSQPLFDTLNQLADTMRLRWRKERDWLQLRSTTYYDDRLKEVPNRLLDRWAAARREQGHLTLDHLVEIAALTNAQLDGRDMAEGAKAAFGLAEWDLVRAWPMRPHLRYLASFTPAQRQEMLTPAGLAFTRMSLAQQQRYLTLALDPDDPPLGSLEELAGAVLRVDYTQPGEFEWRLDPPLEWVVPLERGLDGRRVIRPPVRARTREEALDAARRFDPQLRAAMIETLRRLDPRPEAIARVEQPEITPTTLRLIILYIPGQTNRREFHLLRPGQDLTTGRV
jgi:hypothetical protein